MSHELIAQVEKKYKVARPQINIGDTVVVDTVIRDGDKQRIQKFKGLVIAIKGKGLTKTFTVRKISYGIGVEKTFPLYSTNVSNIEIVRHANVKRSKLYYIRERVGKAASFLKPGKDITEESNMLIEIEKDEEVETKPEEVKEEVENKTSDESNEEVKEEKIEETKAEDNQEEKKAEDSK